MEFSDSRVFVNGQPYMPFVQDYMDALLKKAELIEGLTPKEKDFINTYTTFMKKERELMLVHQLFADRKLTKSEFLAVIKTDEEIEDEIYQHILALNDNNDNESDEL